MIRELTASIVLSLALTGCAATSALSAVTSAINPDKPEITAQVGAENVKQGLGANTKVETSTTTKVGDVAGQAVVTQTTTKKSGQIETGAVAATNITYNTTNPWPLLTSYALGLLSVLGLVFWFVPTPKSLLSSKET